MIGLLFTLCLFGTVKSSDIVDPQVQTVRRRDNTTIKCHQNETKHDLLTWYQQSLGKLPQYIVRQFKTEEQKVNHTFSKKFINSRFTVDNKTFDLSINGVKEEDVGIYFCGKGEKNSSEFLSGTLLLFADEKTPPDPAIKNCSVQAVTLSCSGDRSVYWIRHGSGESHHDHEAKSTEEGDVCTVWFFTVKVVVLVVLFFTHIVLYIFITCRKSKDALSGDTKY
uniref:Ig-like domain-containing protein n=1 Tax=Pygocentrus nattereri TaxID=42514 RepID=A0AAR2K484_PYGNA